MVHVKSSIVVFFSPGEIVQARSVAFRAHTQFLCGLRERSTQAGRGIPVTGTFGIRPGGSARSKEDRTVEFYIDRTLWQRANTDRQHLAFAWRARRIVLPATIIRTINIQYSINRTNPRFHISGDVLLASEYARRTFQTGAAHDICSRACFLSLRILDRIYPSMQQGGPSNNRTTLLYEDWRFSERPLAVSLHGP